jgi:ribulose-5-phosphate 4-epimerase/fuculose-1-phosphate aldolase
MQGRSSGTADLVTELVLANRILANQGVLDGFGHVSARHPTNPHAFLISQSRAPSAITAADIMELDLDGNAVVDTGLKAPLERFIHSEILKARPEVMAVVHSHSPAIIPFGVTAAGLRAVCHVSAFLGTRTPVFEIRDSFGLGTDLLIRNLETGAALARSLGSGPVVLLRGHGNAVVGESLRHAVYRAIYTELNARLQAEALRLGEVTFLTEDEAVNAARSVEGDLSKPWEHWTKQVRLD